MKTILLLYLSTDESMAASEEVLRVLTHLASGLGAFMWVLSLGQDEGSNRTLNFLGTLIILHHVPSAVSKRTGYAQSFNLRVSHVVRQYTLLTRCLSTDFSRIRYSNGSRCSSDVLTLWSCPFGILFNLSSTFLPSSAPISMAETWLKELEPSFGTRSNLCNVREHSACTRTSRRNVHGLFSVASLYLQSRPIMAVLRLQPALYYRRCSPSRERGCGDFHLAKLSC
ncbi:hypothetical protein C8Q75DRAFT_489125 [Abortiporus biennis]|nr:hypothetical protein C8Q75DRAFT_489125 [Abortiporus biennis]